MLRFLVKFWFVLPLLSVGVTFMVTTAIAGNSKVEKDTIVDTPQQQVDTRKDETAINDDPAPSETNQAANALRSNDKPENMKPVKTVQTTTTQRTTTPAETPTPQVSTPAPQDPTPTPAPQASTPAPQDPTPAPAPTPAPVPEKAVVKKSIYCIGNSLTFGTGSGGDDYTDRLGSLLGPNWTVENHGVPGNTTSQISSRFDPHHDYVIIWGGVNDVYQSLSVETTKENLAGMYNLAHERGAKVIALNLPPSAGDKTWTVEKQQGIESINGWIETSDADYKVDIYSLVGDPNKSAHILPLYDAGDGLHLQQDGYWAVGESIYALINKIETN